MGIYGYFYIGWGKIFTLWKRWNRVYSWGCCTCWGTDLTWKNSSNNELYTNIKFSYWLYRNDAWKGSFKELSRTKKINPRWKWTRLLQRAENRGHAVLSFYRYYSTYLTFQNIPCIIMVNLRIEAIMEEIQGFTFWFYESTGLLEQVLPFPDEETEELKLWNPIILRKSCSFGEEKHQI